MRFVIQRVMHSKVTINGEVRGQIGKGFMVLIGVGEEDTVEIADKMIHKMVNMRIFEDENGKTNLGLKEVGGSLLLISQFTLYADCKRGISSPNSMVSVRNICMSRLQSTAWIFVRKTRIPMIFGA